MNVTRVLRILSFFGLAIGLLLLVVTLVFGGSSGDKSMLSASGEVLSVDNFKPTVRFPINNGQTVTAVAPVSPGYNPGQKVRVFYDPANPQHFFISSGGGFRTALIAIGALLALAGAAGLFFLARIKSGIARLRSNGVKVAGRIVDVKRDAIEINGKPTWKISLDWNANGVAGHGTTRVMRDPRPLLGARTDLDVWVDPKNPKSYWVDTDFLK